MSTTPAPTSPAVVEATSTAFGLGWQMSCLFVGPLAGTTPPKVEDDLPGLNDLPVVSLVTLGLARIDVALLRLGAFLTGATLPSTEATRAEITQEPKRAAIREAILNLDVELLVGLTAADFRLG